MLVDFHTHSTASDGAMAPAALLQRALERGVGMLAITDHDTVDGYLQARADAPPIEIVQFVVDYEFSTM